MQQSRRPSRYNSAMADLRKLPRVDRLAASPGLQDFSPAVRTEAARSAIHLIRETVQNGLDFALEDAESLARQMAAIMAGPSLRRVLNASGVILHTGLGRARLAEVAARRVFEVARDHANLELDLEDGERGDRQDHVRELLIQLTGADDALVVNNCAAAVFLTLTALCKGGDVVLSRGEMVEIGGSFRMPDIVAETGCHLVEVGCTNKTRISDYETAIGANTVALLRCHPSNFRVIGFTASAPSAELAQLARKRELLFIHDLGNGALFDTAAFGLPHETTIAEAVADGADIVTASGDKLLGGPQAGLILGNASLIAAVKSHPLARAFRVDKLTLAALESTLRLHVEKRLQELPVFRAMSRPLDEVKRDAETLARALPGKAEVAEGVTEVGGGSLPGTGIATWRCGLCHPDVETFARRLRMGHPAVLGRIEKGRLWLDPRTLESGEVEELAEILENLEAS